MAYCFGDGFDLYAVIGDTIAGYWDSGAFGNVTLAAGRFAGSQGLNIQTIAPQTILVKSSAVNDAVHHIVVAFRQTAALSGTILATYFQLSDAATNQCCIVFRSDGAILLTSATPAGTVLDTYTGAVTAQNTWFAFEFEVVINNTTGSWAVRKNGNTSNDHALGSLNTRPGANAYANKLTMGMNAALTAQQLDDLLWRSDASSVAWVGDIRCYTRMPAADVQAQFTRLGGATNFSQVSEAHQDGATSYVFDANVGDADFYTIGTIASTPALVVAVTTRGFLQKSDAGVKGAAVQIKSGGTTVASTATLLSSTFGWLWRTDTLDPATGTAWTATGVNNAQIGPIVTS